MSSETSATDTRSTSTAGGATTPVSRVAAGGALTRGGPVLFSPTYLRLDLRRILRNRRTLIFLLVMPVAFFLLFGLPYKNDGGDNKDVFAYIMVSMAVYGAMIATTSTGANVSVERSQGWTRQLRLTPLRPVGYVLCKVLAALALAVVPVLLVLATGMINGVRLSFGQWVGSGVAAWVCSLVFAAFGLFMGYLIPSENVMQFIGPILALLSFFGGLFTPIDQLPHAMQTIAHWMPTYAIGEIARSPITHSGFTAGHVALLVIWTAIFGLGAAALFRRDTHRV